jgi:hypothetical protein
MTPRTATTMATARRGVGDEEGLVENLHHFAADFAVGDGEGVVLRAEDRFELFSRGVAGDSGLEVDDDGGDGVVVVGADVEVAVHGDDAAVVGVIAVDAGDREAARAGDRVQRDVVAGFFSVLQREALRHDHAAFRDRVPQRLGGLTRGDHLPRVS